jgi:predicted transcriptional regulator
MTGIVADIVRRLADAKGKWRQIAIASGVPYDTLTKIAQGKTKNPRVETIVSLDEALRESKVDTIKLPRDRAKPRVSA